jgi:hypothetical protein
MGEAFLGVVVFLVLLVVVRARMAADETRCKRDCVSVSHVETNARPEASAVTA